MKRLYIITGAKGHVASTIIKKLKGEDCLIRGLILESENGIDDEQITYYKGDVTKKETLTSIFADVESYETIVIHTAAIINITSAVSDLMYNVNVNGTKNIVDICKSNPGIKRLVHVSSVHAIPEKPHNGTIEEVKAFAPEWVEGAYAKTKAEASQYVMDAVKDGLNAVIVHPSGILGPYDKGSNHMTQLMQTYISGKLPAGVTGGYDFVDVRDVAKACIAAADKGKTGECYIISGRYVSVRELLEFMRVATGGKKKLCFPLAIAKVLAPAFEKAADITHTRPLFTRYSLYTLDSNGHFSHDKATMELGYHPRDIMDTVADTVNWLKENNFTAVSA